MASKAHAPHDIHNAKLGIGNLSSLNLDDPETPYTSDNATNFEGNVINVAFSLPLRVELNNKGAWEVHTTNSNPLYDSFAYTFKSSWYQTLVTWTGPIHQPCADTILSPGSSTSRSIRSSEDSSGSESRSPRRGRGMPISPFARELLHAQLTKAVGGKVAPVWLFDAFDEPSETGFLRDQERWSRYAEQELYQLLHYQQPDQSSAAVGTQWWADYCELNKAFADRILSIYKPGDIIWIHDYHLCLLPALLRHRLPHASIGFYLHTPFPSNEILRCLIKREDILLGMLGSTVIGFQGNDFATNFISSCTHLLSVEASEREIKRPNGARTTTMVLPDGIDAETLQNRAFALATIDSKVKDILEHHSSRKILIGRDEFNSSSGVLQKLQAFEVFLNMFPEWIGHVIMVQFTGSRRGDNQCHHDSLTISKISDLRDRINARHETLGYTPVQVHFGDVSEDEYLAYLRAADVGIVTSLRESISKTALDYVVCQRDSHGPLIMSEFSGTHEILSQADTVNPWDLEEVAAAIRLALVTSEEDKILRHAELYRRVMTSTIRSWTEHSLQAICSLGADTQTSLTTPSLPRDIVRKKYREPGQRLFMLDYDGTLTPIVKDPEAAVPSEKLLQSLRKLAEDQDNALWIISGRDQTFLEKWMGNISELGLSAEHGSFIRQPGSTRWENTTEQLDMGWQEATLEILEEFKKSTPRSVIERKQVALTWHYRLSDPEVARKQVPNCKRRLRNTVASQWDVEVMSGKANIEVRPTFANKGEIVKRLIGQYRRRGLPRASFVLCVGDDATDEDMFGVLNALENQPKEGIFACTVGSAEKDTLAKWHLAEPEDVVDLLEDLSLSEEQRQE